MKYKSLSQISITGLVLAGASAIIAAVLPENNTEKKYGRLVASANGYINQLTCSRDAYSGAYCSWTRTLPGSNGHDGVGSRTTTQGSEDTSSITNEHGIAVTTLTIEGRHTSHF